MCLAIPALVTQVLPDKMARISLDGVMKTISVMLVEGVVPGDYVIVHVGHALAKIDPEEAERTLALLAEAATLCEAAEERA
jgi:hydrogenase expression/formation protein HypC